MIRRIPLLFAALALSTSVFGQVTFGMKAGTNLAKMNYSDVGISIDAKIKAGLIAGGFVNFNVDKRISIQPELLFSQGGGTVDTIDKEENSYIVVPLMLKYSLGRFKILAGPQLGYFLSAKENGKDVKNLYKSFDFGLTLGAGYEIESGFGLDARYCFGMANINNDGTSLVVKNYGFQLVLYCRFK